MKPSSPTNSDRINLLVFGPGGFFVKAQTKVVCFSLVNIKSTKNECCVALSAVITKKT